MSAARLLREVRAAGLQLGVSPNGKLACKGPAQTFERLKPTILENRDALLEALRAECRYDPKRLQAAAARRNSDAIDAGWTDRYCACGRLASTAWPDSRGRQIWICDDCAPTMGGGQ